MVFKGEINPSKRAYILYLARDKKLSVQEIVQQCNVSRATAYRIMKTNLMEDKRDDKKHPGGRPKKLSAREERKIIRTLKCLRHEEGNFSSIRLMSRAGISQKNVSNRTVRRFLEQNGYHFLQARKKGLLTSKDVKERLAFAKRMKKSYSKDVWKDSVAFYLDGVSFCYKTNPADQATAPHGRIWRKKSEGLMRGCTAKGSKVGSGGKVVKLIVAISYGKGAIICHKYDKLDGAYFAAFVNDNFDRMFMKANKNGSRLWVQDNCPVQNSACVRKVVSAKNAEQLKIPPRSADIHCIENFFHVIKLELEKQALELNITRETYDEFSARVIATIKNIPVHVVDKIIESMDKRMTLVIDGKGQRTKY